MTQEMWESRYSQPDRVWSDSPNRWLVELADQLVPGTAVDVGCGEGADAVWLAGHGWTVTALDFSRSALRTGADAAESAGLGESVTWLAKDLNDWAPEPTSFDLVSVQFFHGEPATRRAVHRAAWRATVGTLIVVGHDPSNVTEGHGGPPDESVLYTAEDVVDSLDLTQGKQDVVVAERRARYENDPEKIMWDSLVVVSRGK